MKPEDNVANMSNANLGSLATNRQYDQVHGNRSKQLQEILKQQRNQKPLSEMTEDEKLHALGWVRK